MDLEFPTPGDALQGPELFRLPGKIHAGIRRVGRGWTAILKGDQVRQCRLEVVGSDEGDSNRLNQSYSSTGNQVVANTKSDPYDNDFYKQRERATTS